ncbi:MAG: polymerase/3-5 exonuclease PolX [Ferruginibacter sp.]|nr:polymerase/3-5 exonuclease PolX [Ferruginibacter sp.]
MTNYQIADSFSLLAKLLDIHGENSFKSKSYAITAFNIEKLPMQLSETPREKIAGIKGIGASSAQKITELLDTGKLSALEEIISKTPPGVIEMLNIKGIGPKKINSIWKEMEIETVGELLYACKENRLKFFKGFGEKTQQAVADTIEFYQKNQGSHLYRNAEILVAPTQSFLEKIFPGKRVALTGNFLRQLETIDDLQFVVEMPVDEVEKTLAEVDGFTFKKKQDNRLYYSTTAGVDLTLIAATPSTFISTVLHSSSSPEFAEALQNLACFHDDHADDAAFFTAANLPFIPAYLREDASLLTPGANDLLANHIQHGDIKGIIHSHSNWSDGNNTIEEMAKAAISRGLEYLVVSDHSKSAFYAQGLNEEKIQAQHIYIDELNEQFSPFRIFKSIESDILNDGSLDYADDVLATFDLVIASVHSNLKMTEEKAMARLLKAIENPYTTILGHMTGRLLLSRKGYPVDHKKIIDACAANHVVIELNAHPNRLDMDWREIRYALDKNVLISIDPDSHYTEGLDDTRYGIMVAQKAMLPKEKNLSSFSLAEFETFITERKKMKGI